MNNVSWRRILQSAGNEYSGEDDDASPSMQQPRPPEPYDSYTSQSKWRQSGKSPGELEGQLRRSLDRTANREAPPRRHEENWDPIFLAQELENPVHQPPQRGRQVQAAQVRVKKGGSGARNILAISLSAAVVGLAIQQIGMQWTQSNGNAAKSDIDAASVTSFGKYEAKPDQTGYAVLPVAEPERQAAAVATEEQPPQALSLQPDDTVSEADAEPVGGDDFDAEIAKAAQIFAQREQEAREAAAREQAAQRSQITPTAAPPQPLVSGANDLAEVAPLLPDEEQNLLARGKKLLRIGDISSARLLFENLAIRESAFGAFALAQTYDQDFLKTLPNTRSGLADKALAEKWYSRAVSLGERAALAD